MNQPIIQSLQPYLQSVWEKSGYTKLTAIQERAIPAIVEGRDIIAQSPTGSGKTLAYLLPILDQIDPASSHLQAAVLAPSRELVMQIFEEAQKWAEGSSIRIASLVGGANVKRQLEKLKKKPHLIIGTPGRLHELIQIKKLKMHEVKIIVLDEGDQLLSPEHLPTVRTIVKSAMNDRQLILFSATTLQEPETFEVMINRKAEQMAIQDETDGEDSTEHLYITCEHREKAKLLERIAKAKYGKTLAFVKDVGSMNVLAEKLKYEGVSFGLLHSDLRKEERERSLTQLRNGVADLLLATDVAARGLDVEGLDYVVHYDFPSSIEQYIHRSGRTGRMGAAGTVISLVSPREERELRKYGRELSVQPKKARLYKGEIINFEDKDGMQV